MKLMILSLMLACAKSAHADANVPYLPRDFKVNQDAGGVNQNFQDITGRNKDNLVPVVKDNACATGQALTGATQKNGYIFGGSCMGNLATTTSSSTFTQQVTFAGGMIVSSGAQINNSTTTAVPATTTAATIFGTCMATVTLHQAYNSKARVWYSGNGYTNGGNGFHAYASFLRNGQFVSPMTNLKGLAASRSAGGADPEQNLSFNYLLDPVGAEGDYAYCITGRAEVGGSSMNFSNQADTTNQFGAKEEK